MARWTDEDIAALRIMWAKGIPATRIAAHLSYHLPWNVRKKAKDLGLEPRESSDFWTPETVATLKELWPTGISATEIGKRMGATKNQVLGKVFRLKLKPRPSPLPKDTEHRENVVNTIIKTEPRPLERVTLETVTGCRWPIGDPLDADFCFCDAERVAGKSYCAEHQSKAYMKLPKKKRKAVFNLWGVGI